jgi:hypothetical protein
MMASPALAQWTAGVEVGANRYWGGSIELGGEGRSFRPYRPTTVGIGLERSGKSLSLGLQVHYSQAGLGLEGEGAAAIVEGVFEVLSVSPELVRRLVTIGPLTELRLHAGPLFEVWDIIDEETKLRVGAETALSLDIPLGGRFGGSLRAGVAVTPSVFAEGQLGSAFEPRALWSRRFALGLHYRL